MVEEHYDWVAQYLVVKRASIEPNFHNLYMSFLDALSSTYLRKGVIRETYRNIKVRCEHEACMYIRTMHARVPRNCTSDAREVWNFPSSIDSTLRVKQSNCSYHWLDLYSS